MKKYVTSVTTSGFLEEKLVVTVQFGIVSLAVTQAGAVTRSMG